MHADREGGRVGTHFSGKPVNQELNHTRTDKLVALLETAQCFKRQSDGISVGFPFSLASFSISSILPISRISADG